MTTNRRGFLAFVVSAVTGRFSPVKVAPPMIVPGVTTVVTGVNDWNLSPYPWEWPGGRWVGDGIHPGPRGAQLMAEAVARVLSADLPPVLLVSEEVQP